MSFMHPRHVLRSRSKEELKDDDALSDFFLSSHESDQSYNEDLNDPKPERNMANQGPSSSPTFRHRQNMAKVKETSHHDHISKVRHQRNHGRDLEAIEYLAQQHHHLGMVTFTDEDLKSISRRKPLMAMPGQQNDGVAAFRRASIALANQHKPHEQRPGTADSVVADLPTGLRAQQEKLSALQKENFDLKLSLHSHRRKESLQNAHLSQVENKLADAEIKTRAIEEKLKDLRGEIVSRYRDLEKLVGKHVDPGEEDIDTENVQRERRDGIAMPASAAESKESVPKSADDFLDLVDSNSTSTSVAMKEKDDKGMKAEPSPVPAPNEGHPIGIRPTKKHPPVAVRTTKTAANPAPTRRHHIETKFQLQDKDRAKEDTTQHGQMIELRSPSFRGLSVTRIKRKSSDKENVTSDATNAHGIYTGPDNDQSEDVWKDHQQESNLPQSDSRSVTATKNGNGSSSTTRRWSIRAFADLVAKLRCLVRKGQRSSRSSKKAEGDNDRADNRERGTTGRGKKTSVRHWHCFRRGGVSNVTGNRHKRIRSR